MSRVSLTVLLEPNLRNFHALSTTSLWVRRYSQAGAEYGRTTGLPSADRSRVAAISGGRLRATAGCERGFYGYSGYAKRFEKSGRTGGEPARQDSTSRPAGGALSTASVQAQRSQGNPGAALPYARAGAAHRHPRPDLPVPRPRAATRRGAAASVSHRNRRAQALVADSRAGTCVETPPAWS